MSTQLESSPELENILAHMETDKHSIAPYLNGYVIAPNSKKAKKAATLKPESRRSIAGHSGHIFVEKSDWEKVKDVRV
ncbi:MAG TPA: hypothetical protein VL576_03345 [Candidatus Paceibacterota bacterium]|jgi:hypothetical protein|nr:hypothetical protein [Candidatus Paceibacterota bacterium]